MSEIGKFRAQEGARNLPLAFAVRTALSARPNASCSYGAHGCQMLQTSQNLGAFPIDLRDTPLRSVSEQSVEPVRCSGAAHCLRIYRGGAGSQSYIEN